MVQYRKKKKLPVHVFNDMELNFMVKNYFGVKTSLKTVYSKNTFTENSNFSEPLPNIILPNQLTFRHLLESF